MTRFNQKSFYQSMRFVNDETKSHDKVEKKSLQNSKNSIIIIIEKY